MTDVRIDLVRLTEVPLDAVVALLNEPRNTRHMPLSNPFTPESAREWVQAKDGQWAEHGYGPWAVLPHTRSPDRAVARLGFQPDGEVDYGGVVFRQYRLTRQAWDGSPRPGVIAVTANRRRLAVTESETRRREMRGLAVTGSETRPRRWRSGAPGPRRRVGAPP